MAKTKFSGKYSNGQKVGHVSPANTIFQNSTAKPQKIQERQTVTQDLSQITLSDYESVVPKTMDVKIPGYDIESTASNPFLLMIQAELKTIQQENPVFFNDGALTAAGTSFTGYAFFFFWIIASHLKRVCSLYGAVPNEADWAMPPVNCPVPNGLAKFLEYFGPYKDKDTGCTYQTRFKLDTWANLSTTANDYMSSTTNNPMLNTGIGGRTAWNLSGNNLQTYNQSSNLAGTINLQTILGTYDNYNNNLKNMRGFTSFKNIPLFAPDNSANSDLDPYNDVGFRNPCPHFDPDMSQILCFNNLSNSPSCGFVFQKTPALPTVAYLNSAAFTSAGVLQNYGCYDSFAFQMRQCTWETGKYNYMLQTSIYAGGKGLRTYVPTFVRIDSIGLKHVIHSLTYQYDQAGYGFDAGGEGIFNLYYMAVLALCAKIGRYAHCMGIWAFGTQDVTGYAPAALKVSFPPLIADYISSAGPVNINGILFLPMMVDEKLNGSLAYQLFNNPLPLATTEHFYTPAITMKSGGLTWGNNVGNYGTSQNVSTIPNGNSDYAITKLNPSWTTALPFSSVDKSMWITPVEQVFGDIAMYGAWELRGWSYENPTNSAMNTGQINYLFASVSQISSIVPMDLQQLQRAARRSFLSNTLNLNIANQTTNNFIKNPQIGNQIFCAQRTAMRDAPYNLTELAVALDTPEAKEAFGVARGNSLLKKKAVNPMNVLNNMFKSIEGNNKDRVLTEGFPRIVPQWLMNGVSSMYNSEPGRFIVKEIGNTVVGLAKAKIMEALGKGRGGGIADAIAGFVTGPKRIAHSNLITHMPRIKIEDID